ncbi:hypothetical protein [Sphingobium sp. SCG-1]|uniref:hypothetical protein n=1 Tax=Sphingobium sp. SCG-1 TaxID=2072936 RepID=UPI001671314C|nr:hypothetical protein [Sphingobium sp. SCG-1]
MNEMKLGREASANPDSIPNLARCSSINKIECRRDAGDACYCQRHEDDATCRMEGVRQSGRNKRMYHWDNSGERA